MSAPSPFRPVPRSLLSGSQASLVCHGIRRQQIFIMIIGIDLGTTNSLVGIWRDGEAVLIPNALGSLLTPSVVAADDDGRILVGQAARDRLITHPANTAATFKRYMGTDQKITVATAAYRAPEFS